MPMKGSGLATDWEEIDRYESADGREAGVGWIAYPEEGMERASHAVAVDGEVWVIDPVDVEGLDDLLAELGTVAGVVVLLDRHKRDAAAVATRHGVDVYLPEFMQETGTDIDAPVETVRRSLLDTGFTVRTVVDNFAWSEAALYRADSGTLIVPEAVGTSDYYLAGEERLGVHPALRLVPPRALRGLEARRILAGHGRGIHEDAAASLSEALRNSRSRTPQLYLKTLRMFLPG
jgi:hypothetical protein